MTADRLLFLALKVTNRNIRKRCEVYLKLTIKTLESVMTSLFFIDSEQINISWEEK